MEAGWESIFVELKPPPLLAPRLFGAAFQPLGAHFYDVLARYRAETSISSSVPPSLAGILGLPTASRPLQPSKPAALPRGKAAGGARTAWREGLGVDP